MISYPRIRTVFKRNMQHRGGTLIESEWTLPAFEYLAANQWLFTEKVDGTNIRIMWDGTKVIFSGRTDSASIPVTLFTRLQELFPNSSMFQTFTQPVCLYGEGYGPGIQTGGKYRDNQDFVLFDVRVGTRWLERKNVEHLAKAMGLHIVPIISWGTLLEGVELVRKGFVSAWGDFPAEGLVMRPGVELSDKRGERIITKIKYRDFVR